MSKPKNVLIAGAGIAGPALGFMLARNGHKVTIVERAPAIRRNGQQIDVAGEGVDVVKAMGVWDQLLQRTVGDQGIKFVDENDAVWASFPVDKESNANSFVKEIEILRGEMADVLYEATKNDCEYVFSDSITALNEHADSVTVSFQNGDDRDFHIIVAADGLYSHTRDLAFGPEHTEIRSLDQCCALMSIPWEESHGEWTKWMNAPGGRTITIRPQPRRGTTGAYLAVMTKDAGNIARLPLDQAVDKFTEMFEDVGWMTPSILRQLAGNESLYVTQTAQTHAKSWSKGRVALLGDAGYCPSPVSGQGSTLAYVGAYVLAGCICTHDDVSVALQEYEKDLKPFVKKAQELIPGVPGIANPQTAWGIKIFYSFLWVVDRIMAFGIGSLVAKLLSPVTSYFDKGPELPRYPAMKL